MSTAVLRTGIVLLSAMFMLMSMATFAAAASATSSLSEVIADCVLCHGTDGRGNEAVAAPRIAGMEDWYLQRQLEAFRLGWRGVHAADDEGREMQPMAAVLREEDIAAVAAWFANQVTPDPLPTLNGAADRGQRHYTLVCAQCHGARGQGNRSLAAPALAGQNDWYLVRQLHLYRHQIRGHVPEDSHGMQMMAMIGTLVDDQAVLDVVAFINTFTHPAPNAVMNDVADR